MDKIKKQEWKRLQNEAYLKHFKDIDQNVPIWTWVDLLTIHDISILYSISMPEIKHSVSGSFDLNKMGGELLGQFMHSMTILRNLCAHGCRLYNRLFEQKPFLNKREKELLRKNRKGTIDNAHLYGFIFIMRRLLLPDEFQKMKSEIMELSAQYPFVRLDYYGFRSDWKNVL